MMMTVWIFELRVYKQNLCNFQRKLVQCRENKLPPQRLRRWCQRWVQCLRETKWCNNKKWATWWIKETCSLKSKALKNLNRPLSIWRLTTTNKPTSHRTLPSYRKISFGVISQSTTQHQIMAVSWPALSPPIQPTIVSPSSLSASWTSYRTLQKQCTNSSQTRMSVSRLRHNATWSSRGARLRSAKWLWKTK